MLAIRVGVRRAASRSPTAAGPAPRSCRRPPRAADRGPPGCARTERLAAILAGRDVALACEELTLRARDRRRRRALARLRVPAARRASTPRSRSSLPWSGQADIDERIAELRELRPAVVDAADAALEGGLDDARIAALTHALTRLEAALRARTNAQLGG